MALVGAVAVGLGSYWDFRQSSDRPSEMATVVSRQISGPHVCPGVGRRQWDPQWDVTWRSKNPPDGLPAEFVAKKVCDDNEVGDIVEIIRVTENGRTKIYQDVPRTQQERFVLAAWTFVFVFVIALAVGWIWLGSSRLWRRFRPPETR